jgi:thiamine-phosphate pyrophosphorylase
VSLRGLYAVTPQGLESELLYEKVQRALEGGLALLQYRNKRLSTEARLQEATRIALLARGYGVPFIVNDDVGLALQAGAQGAHLGREDGELGAARVRLPGKLLGASCYDSLELAKRAVAQGADYVAFGSVFASVTKPDAVRAPLSLFGAARSLGVPLCAIGGITLGNAEQAMQAGADLLAVISDLFDAADVTARARQFGKLFS